MYSISKLTVTWSSGGLGLKWTESRRKPAENENLSLNYDHMSSQLHSKVTYALASCNLLDCTCTTCLTADAPRTKLES